jgi:hypothetical protein
LGDFSKLCGKKGRCWRFFPRFLSCGSGSSLYGSLGYHKKSRQVKSAERLHHKHGKIRRFFTTQEGIQCFANPFICFPYYNALHELTKQTPLFYCRRVLATSAFYITSTELKPRRIFPKSIEFLPGIFLCVRASQ